MELLAAAEDRRNDETNLVLVSSSFYADKKNGKRLVVSHQPEPVLQLPLT